MRVAPCPVLSIAIQPVRWRKIQSNVCSQSHVHFFEMIVHSTAQVPENDRQKAVFDHALSDLVLHLSHCAIAAFPVPRLLCTVLLYYFFLLVIVLVKRGSTLGNGLFHIT